MVCRLAAGLSGLWMTQFYPIPPELQGGPLYVFRLVFGAAMVLSIARSWVVILRGDVAQHRAWLIRAYAIGQGAGTQALIMIPPAILFGNLRGLPRDLLMIAAWVINLTVAEWIIRRRPTPQSRPARAIGR